MKKIYALLVFALPLFAFSQQKDYSRYYNSWRLGLNLGATWQTSDVRDRAGVAGGFTLERGFLENKTNFFSLAIRGRYLAGNTFGSGYSRNYGVKDNDALNGKYDPTVNYADSVPAGRRYVYDNYKMKLGEGALELQLGFNRLREQTHVILNLWGGVGITSYRVKTNLKDANGKLYDFSQVDSSGNATKALSSLKSMYDNSYESDAYGSKAGNIVTFSPSCGIGLGYQFSPGFSIIAEYKLTFPQGVNADLLDGKIAHNNDKIAGSKDYYHYAGINLLFTLRAKKHVKDTTRSANVPPPVYTNPVGSQPTYTAAPTSSVVTAVPPVNNTPSTPAQYTIPKPIVDFIMPAVSSSTVSQQPYKITAQVLNVENASQIQVKLNAFTQNNFTFNPQTQIVEFMANLQEGVNFVKIKGTNLAGTDAKTVFIDYRPAAVVPQGNPPQVVITNPVNSPYTTPAAHFNLFSNVSEVPSAAYITVKVNGVLHPNVSYNVATTHLIVPLDLVEGNNLVEISATNAYGSDSKTTVIVYQREQVKVLPPVVTFIDPLQNPATSPAANYVVKAQVLNVNSQSQVSVQVNGQGATFSYDNNLKQVTIPSNLNVGYNVVSVSASNSAGNDSKSVNINYKPLRPTGIPPQITFTQPTPGSSTSAANFVYRAIVQNIASASQLSATFNGSPVTAFTLNGTDFEFYALLKPGLNVLKLSATNVDGSDTKSAMITQNVAPPVTPHPPVVTIIHPTGNPMVSDANYAFQFNVTNVQQNQVEVRLNGVPVTSFNFNNGSGSFTGTLQEGQNNLQVGASNNDGTDHKKEFVTYRKNQTTQPAPTPTPPQPVLAPTGGAGKSDAEQPPNLRFTNPPASPYDGQAGAVFTYKADVLNITSSSQVQAVYNGSQVSNFNFDAVRKQVSYTTTLSPGDNTLTITVTNSAGSKQKSAMLKVAANPAGNPAQPGPDKNDSAKVIRGNRTIGRP